MSSLALRISGDDYDCTSLGEDIRMLQRGIAGSRDFHVAEVEEGGHPVGFSHAGRAAHSFLDWDGGARRDLLPVPVICNRPTALELGFSWNLTGVRFSRKANAAITTGQRVRSKGDRKVRFRPILLKKSVAGSPGRFSSKLAKLASSNISDLAWQLTRQMRSKSRVFASVGLFQQYRSKADASV